IEIGVAPQNTTARSSMWNAGTLRSISTTRSPGSTPSACSPAAAPATWAAYSSYVHSSQPPSASTVRRNAVATVCPATARSMSWLLTVLLPSGFPAALPILARARRVASAVGERDAHDRPALGAVVDGELCADGRRQRPRHRQAQAEARHVGDGGAAGEQLEHQRPDVVGDAGALVVDLDGAPVGGDAQRGPLAVLERVVDEQAEHPLREIGVDDELDLTRRLDRDEIRIGGGERDVVEDATQRRPL